MLPIVIVYEAFKVNVLKLNRINMPFENLDKDCIFARAKGQAMTIFTDKDPVKQILLMELTYKY